MGLDIRFSTDDPAAAELDGTRLTTLPGFLNFARVLGPVLGHLNDPDDQERRDTYRGVVRYVELHPEAVQRFQEYLAFAVRFMEHAGAQPDFPVNSGDYDAIASTFAAALMLRDEPMGGDEAGRVLSLTAFIHGFAPVLLYVPASGIGRQQVGWMIQVLETYNRCLEVASEHQLSFQISF